MVNLDPQTPRIMVRYTHKVANVYRDYRFRDHGRPHIGANGVS